jgi:phosphoribosylanthranilate isomerase
MDTRVKICGLREPAHVAAAAEAGAAYVGFVFFAKSPRNLSVSRMHDRWRCWFPTGWPRWR